MQFLKILWSKLKSWLPLVIMVVFLSVPAARGLMQSTLMLTGIFNAGTTPEESTTPFDYSMEITTLDGKRTSLQQLKNKVLFINLWATWCGPCRAEMPSIQALYEKSDTSKIKFIILSIDKPGDFARVRQYVTKEKYTFPVYTPVSLTTQLDVPSIPTTFIVNPSGKIVRRETGVTNFNTKKFQRFLHELAK